MKKSLKIDLKDPWQFHIKEDQEQVPCRYDFIYATKDLEPIFVDYCYDKATKAGSDHAIVIAELVLEKGKFL